jgi:hypothetical protein
MALYIPHSISHLARLLYVRPETFGPYCVLSRHVAQALAKLFWDDFICLHYNSYDFFCTAHVLYFYCKVLIYLLGRQVSTHLCNCVLLLFW